VRGWTCLADRVDCFPPFAMRRIGHPNFVGSQGGATLSMPETGSSDLRDRCMFRFHFSKISQLRMQVSKHVGVRR